MPGNPEYVWAYQKGAVSKIAYTLLARDGPKADVGVIQDYVPRRYLAVERERLQGFPDGWTDIVFRGRPASHDERSKALGNSMPVTVMAWIGAKLARVETLRRWEAEDTAESLRLGRWLSSRIAHRVPQPGTHSAEEVALSKLDFLMPRRTQKVLFALLAKPGREFTLAELFKVAGEGRGATQEIVEELLEAWIIVERRTKSRRYLRSHPTNPLVETLRTAMMEARCIAEGCACCNRRGQYKADEVIAA